MKERNDDPLTVFVSEDYFLRTFLDFPFPENSTGIPLSISDYREAILQASNNVL